MITAYHGTNRQDLVITHHTRSRYGIKAFFCTTNRGLAELYRDHYKAQTGGADAALYEVEVEEPDSEVDYEFKETYHKQFRKMIYDLAKSKCDVVRIANAIDFPAQDNYYPHPSDILVVFNMRMITNIKLITPELCLK